MTSLHSKPLALKNVTVTDSFWRTEQELVRTAVIPYQWNALNDNVPGAAPRCRAKQAQGYPGQRVRAAEVHVPRI